MELYRSGRGGQTREGGIRETNSGVHIGEAEKKESAFRGVGTIKRQRS